MACFYPDEDQSLLDELQKGNEEAFNKLYEKYWSAVYTDASRRLKNDTQAKDITQEIFVKLWIKRNELQIENLPAYLKVCVRNRVLNLFEKEHRYIPFEQLLYDNIQSYGDQADAVALSNECLKAYKALVDALPAQRQKIFLYFYEEGLSTEEIARRLRLSRKTIQNQLGRAASHLKANLSHLFIVLFIIWLYC